jgi:ABC-type antimicrobial peptide transport system permease subunit
MRVWLWIAFFVVANLLGVTVFKAAVTLPWEEALIPALLTVLLVVLSAVGATRIVSAWQGTEE